MIGDPKDVLGILGYLVLRDSTIALWDRWEFPGNPGILSIEGSAIIIALCDGCSQGCPRNPGILRYLVL